MILSQCREEKVGTYNHTHRAEAFSDPAARHHGGRKYFHTHGLLPATAECRDLSQQGFADQSTPSDHGWCESMYPTVKSTPFRCQTVSNPRETAEVRASSSKMCHDHQSICTTAGNLSDGGAVHSACSIPTQTYFLGPALGLTFYLTPIPWDMLFNDISSDLGNRGTGSFGYLDIDTLTKCWQP